MPPTAELSGSQVYTNLFTTIRGQFLEENHLVLVVISVVTMISVIIITSDEKYEYVTNKSLNLEF